MVYLKKINETGHIVLVVGKRNSNGLTDRLQSREMDDILEFELQQKTTYGLRVHKAW